MLQENTPQPPPSQTEHGLEESSGSIEATAVNAELEKLKTEVAELRQQLQGLLAEQRKAQEQRDLLLNMAENAAAELIKHAQVINLLLESFSQIADGIWNVASRVNHVFSRLRIPDIQIPPRPRTPNQSQPPAPPQR